MALAAGGNLKDAYTMGKITALESARGRSSLDLCAGRGCKQQSGKSGSSNTRSFGENPERVAQFVSEFIRGVQETAAWRPQNIFRVTATPPLTRTLICR